MIFWCAYCQRFIGEKPPYENFDITHGVCAECNRKGLDVPDQEVLRLRRIAALHGELLDHGRSGDARAASELVEGALASGIQPVDILVGMLSPALHQLGELWRRGEIGVVDEHRFTAFAESLVELIAARTGPGAPAPGTPYPVVLVNAEGNAHTLGVRIASLWLRSRGIGALPIYPGAPATDLVELVTALRPLALGISVALADQAPGVAALVARLRAVPRLSGTNILVGGNAVKHGLVAPIAGAELAAELDALRAAVEARLATAGAR